MEDFQRCVARISDAELRDALEARFTDAGDRTLICRVVRHFADKENSDPAGSLAASNGLKRASPALADLGPAAKKARAERTVDDSETWCTLGDVSVLLPARKRMNVKFTKDELVLCPTKPDGTAAEIFVRLDAVKTVVVTPSPDKASKRASWTFTVLVDGAGSPSKDSKRKPWEYAGAIAFAVEDGSTTVSRGPPQKAASSTPADAKAAVCDAFRQALKRPVLEPAGRGGGSKGRVHIEACRGAKPCSVYLLSTGILVGYTKPITFVTAEQISDIAICNATSRTFNVEVKVFDRTRDAAAAKTLELSMIDHSAYDDVSQYIADHKRRAANMAKSHATDSNPSAATSAGVQTAESVTEVPGDQGSEDESEDEDYAPESESSAEETGDSSDSEGTGDSDSENGSSDGGSDGDGASDEDDAESGGGESAPDSRDEEVEFED
ncbi:hypothetical protein DFJ74DRAFT_667274 [Hyaloraphidium curvatum]|nr:hypothetical protein DFJ74DRAFT_667274 [Hyaloraphidium curvatum]